MDLNYTTLTQALNHHAEETPDRTAVVLLGEDGSREIISAAMFRSHSMAYAHVLRSIGVQPEDLVILVLQQSSTLLYAFWGAIALGAIVSIFPFLTEKLDPQVYQERVKALVEHSGAKVVITFPQFKQTMSDLLADSGCRVLSTANVPESDLERADGLPEIGDADRIAFLQHSSGTTGLQKGVALTHRAVLNQIRSYAQALRLSEQDVIVSWLPLYHDMGLIAGFVMPLVAGVPLVLMSPFHWVRDPKILFQAVSQYRGTLCWLPNFAYNHLARGVRPRDMDGLRLDSLRAVINCSEPVRYESQQLLLQRFSAHGLRPESLAACYAMAENTFAVTQSALGQPPQVDWVQTRALQEQRLALPVGGPGEGATAMVSCGYPIQGTQVRVVDESRQPLPDRQVGEIALRSNCMLSGYYRRPDATSEAMRDGWFLTGDMGYLADGQVYISGRKKDLIINGGKNIYPQDLEAIANQIEGLHPGRNVAFGVFDERLGSEVIVMVCELEDEQTSPEEQLRLEQELRRRVVQETEVALAAVRLVGRKWLLKTSSGKIARSANRDKYLAET